MRAILERYCFPRYCTIGRMNVGDGVVYTLELPWKDNKPGISCIPPGIYPVHRYASMEKGLVLRLEGVADRDAIEMYAGNIAADTHGGIIVGLTVMLMNEDASLQRSRAALSQLLPWFTQGEAHTLEVRTSFYPRGNGNPIEV